MSKKQIRSLLVFMIALTVFALESFGVVDLSSLKDNIIGQSTLEINNQNVEVVRVIDGDTIKILFNGKEETVRLIGINTPETVDPRREVECFGKEASLRLTEILNDGKVLLVTDPTQGEWDKYKRVLAYVYLLDGTFVNQKMIEGGYAFEYTYNIPYKFQTEFKKLEKEARENGSGLWNKLACDYV